MNPKMQLPNIQIIYSYSHTPIHQITIVCEQYMQLPCSAIQRCDQRTPPQAPNFSSAAHARTYEVQIHSSLLQILLVHAQSCQASLHVKH